jgi:tRNA 2-thiouridine synthesizing protein A
MAMADLDIKLKVDASGLSCPMPIVRTAQAMKTVSTGDLVEVIATDPGSVKDFDAWSKSTGNALVAQDAVGGKFRFVLRRK